MDPCSNRHGGNPESAHAFARGNQEQARVRVLRHIRAQGPRGATVDETAVAFGVTPNQISGRFTALKTAQAIEPVGRRLTRTGTPAAVYISREASE